MGQTVSITPPGEVSVVLCGSCMVYVSVMQPLKSVTLLSSVCHTAASTVGSCVLEGTAGTEGRHRLPTPHSQKYLLQNKQKTTTKQNKREKTHRKQERQRVASAPLPGDTRQSIPWSSFHPKDPFKIWLKKDKHEYRTSLAGRDNAAYGETPATHTMQNLWHHG